MQRASRQSYYGDFGMSNSKRFTNRLTQSLLALNWVFATPQTFETSFTFACIISVVMGTHPSLFVLMKLATSFFTSWCWPFCGLVNAICFAAQLKSSFCWFCHWQPTFFFVYIELALGLEVWRFLCLQYFSIKGCSVATSLGGWYCTSSVGSWRGYGGQKEVTVRRLQMQPLSCNHFRTLFFQKLYWPIFL